MPEQYRRRVIELLQFFRENPVPAEYYDIKKLKGYRDTYRARIGDLRVIYEIMWDQRSIHVLVIKKEKAFTPKQWLGDSMILEVDENQATGSCSSMSRLNRFFTKIFHLPQELSLFGNQNAEID